MLAHVNLAARQLTLCSQIQLLAALAGKICFFQRRFSNGTKKENKKERKKGKEEGEGRDSHTLGDIMRHSSHLQTRTRSAIRHTQWPILCMVHYVTPRVMHVSAPHGDRAASAASLDPGGHPHISSCLHVVLELLPKESTAVWTWLLAGE